MCKKTKIVLILLVPLYCWAQSMDTLQIQKAYHEDIFYLKNIRWSSSNPATIHDAPFDVLDFNIRYLSTKDDFRLINEPSKRRHWNGDIYGVRKFEKIAFLGSIQYSNQELIDSRWNHSLFISKDNPFFTVDSLTSDITLESFKLNGGFSWKVRPQWRAGLRAVYHAGGLADQTDPRPYTHAMRFYIFPGTEYRWNNLSLGLSAGIGFFSESTLFTSVDHLNPNTNFIFLFRGLGNHEPKSSFYRRNTTGNSYSGSIQLGWDNEANLANFLELDVVLATEVAIDNDIYNEGIYTYLYKGGDYQSFRILASDRFRITSGKWNQNITLRAVMSDVSGTWYIQNQKTDSEGNVTWEVKDKSVCYTSNDIEASFAYRLDMMNGNFPSLTFDLKGGVLISDVHQYPEEYYRTYTNALVDAAIQKHFGVGRSILSVSVNGQYATNLDSDLNVKGTKLESAYHTPQFYALCAGYYGGGGGISFKVPLTLKNQPFWVNFFAHATLCKYSGDYEKFKDTGRNLITAGFNLIL